MPTTTISTPDGKLIDVTHPEGAADQDIINYGAMMYSQDPSIAYEEQETTLLGSVGEFGKRALGGIGTGTASVVTGLGQLIPGVDDEAMIAANTSAREAVAEALGYDPAYDEAYLPRLGEVVGEVLPTLIPYFGQAGRAATLASSAGRSVAAGSMMAGQALTEGGYDRQAFEQETGEELSTGERLLSKGRDVLLGQLERVGIPTRILKGLPKGYFASKEGFELGKRLESALMTAGLEGAQEVSQSIIRDVTDLAIYNPDQEIGESALEDFTLGAGAGAFFDLVLGAAEGRRRRADIKPLTEEEKDQEQQVRDEFEASVLRGDARVTQGIAEPGPMPVAQEQDPFATDIDATLSPDDISDTILKRSPSLPVGQTFQLENTPDGYAVTLDGQQYGPKIQDANQAAQVALNLTNASQGRKNIGEVEYLIESSPNEYNETQREQLVVFGRSLQDPTANRYTSSEVDLAVDGEARPTANMSVDELIANKIPRTQWTASQRINAKRQRAGVPVTNRFTLDEIRSVNKGSVGQLGAVLSGRAEAQTVAPVKQGGNYVLRKTDGNVVPRRTYPDFGSATAAARQYNEQELLGKTIPSLDVLSLKGEATNQVANALARKNIAVDVNSKEMRGLIKRLIGKTPKATKPIDNLSPEETQLLLREISQLPQFSEPTSLPDLAAPVPNQELVRRTRRAIEIGQPVPSRAEADFVVGEPVSQAAQRRAEAQARQTAEPIERAGTGVVPEGQGLVPYDPENTGLAQVLRDLVKAFGLSDTINTKLVDRIGTARVNADGDIVIVPSKNGEVAAGSYQHVAKLIQIGLDNIRVKVAEGMSYDEAVADVMNHEIVHALRALDLFTPAEWNLLEKLSRKYKKPSTNQTYTQWAQGRYSDQSPVVRQEEAIAEMIRDALTSGVNMEGGTQRPGGKVRQLLNRLVSFFKKMISSADKAGTPTFDSIIEEIRSGQMGQRSREVRTQFRQERLAGAVPERLIDEEFFGRQRVVGDTSDRRQVQAAGAKAPDGQTLQDAAGLTDDAVYSRKAGRPNIDLRPEVARAYKALQDGQITRVEYQDIVAETVRPYESVPVPATYDEMYNALTRDKREKINVPIEEGSDVGLRLDIPAYTQHGVWVPTIHGLGGKASHRATAAITNADFTRTSEKAAQRIMEAGVEGTEGYAEVQRLKEDLAAGRIDKKKYDARMGQFSKSPFAQIKGEFVNRSDAENYALAQEAIDSPEWTQVGFDPRRRSVFYDRVDGNAVATADEVVQVGPLVLAKNARFRDDDVMFSRSVEKTAGLANAFAIARGQQWKKNRDLKFEIQQRVRAAAKKAGLNIDDQSDETRQYLVNMGVNDAIEALKDNENAIGWYNRTVRKALETIALIHPEIKTDPLARFRFTFALAVTSNGQKVDKNFELAEEVYQRYKRDGVMPTDVEAGETAGAMNKSFKLFNELSDRWGQKTLSEFMDSTFTVEQLNKMGFNVSGELADTRVLGSVIIGPKIGNGFYSNLNGLFNQLTIDRWFMATWGRWTGSLIDERPDMVNAKASEVKAAIKKLTPNQRQAISDAGIDLDASPEIIGLQIKKASSKKENRDVLNRTKAGEQLRLAGNSLAGYLDGQRLSPSGGAERAWIRDVFSGILARLHSQGYNINMSDLQALLWYPEKRLYDASKSKDEASAAGYADEDAPDYANAAAKLAVSMGISPRRIASAQMEVGSERSEPVDGRRGDQQELGGGRAGQDSIQGAGRGLDGRKRRKLLKREILVRSRLGRSGSGKPSKSYKKPSRGTYRGVRGLTHAPSTNFQKLIAAAELRAPTLIELPQTLESAGMFSEAITNSKNASDFGAAVYVYPTAEYRDMKMFITEDGNSGFAIKDDGDIVSVFSNGGGAVHAMLELAVEQGGTKLDAFDTVLPSLYKVSGFKEVGRDSWNEQYKPDDWDKSTFSEFNQGEPDIVYMEYDAAYDPFDTKDKKTFDDDIMMSRVNPRDIEAVVTENKLSAQKATGVPYYSDRAEPRAQYIARNPDQALTPSDDVMFSLQPAKLSSKGQAAVDAIITERTPETMFQSYNEATDQGPISFWLTRLKQWGINRYARLEQLNQDPRLKGLLADSSSIAAALMADRSMGLVGSALKYGIPVYTNGHARVENFVHNGVEYKGLVQINGLLQSTQHGNLSDLAQAYSMAVRGKRLTAEGKAVPITKQQAADIMAEVDSFTDANGANPIKQWYDTYQAYNNKVIEFMEASGVLDPDKAQQWREQSDYIPFYRTDNNGNMAGPARGMFGGLTNAVSFVPYRGSEKSVNVDLIEATSKNLSMAIQMGMQNIAQQRIARDLNTIGLGKRIGLSEEPQGQAITFRVNGKPVRFDVFDPLVYESMQAVGSETSVALAQRFLGAPARFLRESVTRTPSFMIANMMRDTLSTYVTSGANFIPVIDTVKNLNTDLESLEKLGVVGGYDFSNDPESIGKFYAKENAKRGIGKSGGVSVIDGFIRVWDALGTATTKSDAATRKAVYDDVLARTGNHAEAAFQALEVINFSRRGMHPLARVLTAGIPFLNARMQGLDVFARSLAGTYGTDKTKSRADSALSFAFRGGMLIGLTALYYAMVSDDDQYKEQSEEVRDNNFIIPTSMGVPVKLPIPFEVGLMFKTLPETFMAMYDDQKTGKEAYETIKRGIVSTLEINPISGIQAIGPLVEAGINKNFFTGGSIVPYYMTKLEAGAQSYESTAEYAKGIGEMFNISPLKIQHVMEGYGGTSGIFVLDLIDRFLVAPVARDTDMPALKPHEFPVVKRFFAAEHGTGLKQDAYELYGEISKTIQTINKLKQEGRGEELQTYMQSRSTLLSLKKPVYNVKKLLDRSRKQEAMIMRLDIDAELKRKMIDDLKAEVNEALKVVPILKQKADVPVFRSTYG